MKNMFLKYVYELRQRMRIRDMAIFLAVLFIFLFFVDMGKNQYFETLGNRKVFQETESRNVESYVFYTQYGTYGIRLLFIPSPFSVLFNDPLFNSMMANVNSGDKYNIYKPVRGKNFFDRKSEYMNIMGLMLLAASVFGVMYGYPIPKKIGFWRCLDSITGTWPLFRTVFLSRAAVLELGMLVLSGFSLVWLRLHHIDLFHLPLLYIFIMTGLVVIFFFAAGFIIGTIRKKFTRGLVLGGFYLVSFILFPLLLDLHTKIDTSAMEPLFNHELKNLDLIMNVERDLNEKFGKFKSGEPASPGLMKAIDEAVDKEFAELYSRIRGLREEVLTKIKRRHHMSYFYPVLFYKTGVEELSSCGGLSFVEFSRYSEQRKKEFIAFYVKRKFKEASKPGEIENFVKGEENLFYAGGNKPDGYWIGVFMTFIYIIIGMVISYHRFKRLLKPRMKNEKTGKVRMEFERGKEYNISTTGGAATDHLYTILSGEGGDYAGEVVIDKRSIVKEGRQDFIYICSPDDLPGEATLNSLIDLIRGMIKMPGEKARELKEVLGEGSGKKRIEEIEVDERLKVLVKLMEIEGRGINVVEEGANRCTMGYSKEFGERMKGIKGNERLVIYITGQAARLLFSVDHYYVYSKSGDEYTWDEATGFYSNIR